MLGLAAGPVTLVKASDLPHEASLGRAAPLRRALRAAVRWRWLLAAGAVAGALVGVLVTLVATRQYTSTSRLQISRDTAQVVNVGALSRDVPIGDQEFYQTQYGLLHTQALAERVARDTGVVDDPAFFRLFGQSPAFMEAADRARRNELAGQILLHHVVVAPVHGSSLVDIQATTPSRDLSAKVAETWGEDFIASALERRQGASAYARRFLEDRLGQLRDRLERSERQAAAYAAANGIIDLPLAGNGPKPSGADPAQSRSLVTDDLIASNAAREAASVEQVQAGARLAAASDQADASSDALNYRAIGLLRDARAAAAAEYARLSAQPKLDDPALKAVRAQVDAYDAAIQAEKTRVRTALQQTVQAAQTREQTLTRRVNTLKGALADQRQRSVQYNLYQRDAETNRELYDGLLQRYKEIGVAGAAENNNIAVVDAARPAHEPSSPRLTVNLLLSVLVGAALAALVAAMLEHLNGGATEPAAFAETFGLPLLGVAPRLRTGAPLEALDNPRSGFAEAFLVIEANLELAAAQGVARSIAVVSTRPGEGKTITAIALARTLARARRTVVLIDANLRSPSLHAALGLANGRGVGELLAGQADLDPVLQATGIERLSAITAGAGAPNPADLLIGDELARAVRTLHGRFDHVIVDCPAVANLADAALVASAVEGVVYVVGTRSAPAGQVRAAIGRLDRAKLAGGVLVRAGRR